MFEKNVTTCPHSGVVTACASNQVGQMSGGLDSGRPGIHSQTRCRTGEVALFCLMPILSYLINQSKKRGGLKMHLQHSVAIDQRLSSRRPKDGGPQPRTNPEAAGSAFKIIPPAQSRFDPRLW